MDDSGPDAPLIDAAGTLSGYVSSGGGALSPTAAAAAQFSPTRRSLQIPSPPQTGFALLYYPDAEMCATLFDTKGTLQG